MCAARSRANERALLSLTAFARALAHEIRTPLSVISNDLAYFSTHLPQDETARAQARCREINELLKEACRLADAGGSDEVVELPALLLELGESGAFRVVKPLAAGEVRSRRELLRRALASIGAFLNERMGAAEIGLAAGNGAEIMIRCRSSSASEQKEARDFETFSEFFLQAGHSDSILPPIIDASLWACGFDMKLTTEQELTIRLRYGER